MAIHLESVAFASPDPRRDADFWAALLHRPAEADADGILLPPHGDQIGLRFVDGPPRTASTNRLHLHVSEGPRGQAANIAESVRLGGRLRGNGHVPAASSAAMADAVGDDFCVIEDGNAYLAGCGPLGEVTCEGSRDVGLFWSAVLGWPLVWDEGDETAIQSPAGGTKLAWSGDRTDGDSIDGRQTLVLTVTAGEREVEIERMTRLGATLDRTGTLRDPDGVPFVVRTA